MPIPNYRQAQHRLGQDYGRPFDVPMYAYPTLNRPALRSQAEFFMTGVIPVETRPPGEVCTICTEPLVADVVQLVACTHFFHCTCILAWLQGAEKRNCTCPNCRRALYEATPPAHRSFIPLPSRALTPARGPPRGVPFLIPGLGVDESNGSSSSEWALRPDLPFGNAPRRTPLDSPPRSIPDITAPFRRLDIDTLRATPLSPTSRHRRHHRDTFLGRRVPAGIDRSALLRHNLLHGDARASPSARNATHTRPAPPVFNGRERVNADNSTLRVMRDHNVARNGRTETHVALPPLVSLPTPTPQEVVQSRSPEFVDSSPQTAFWQNFDSMRMEVDSVTHRTTPMDRWAAQAANRARFYPGGN
ncbi:uncharacterized protein K460DRAFT_415722 [Cucurbitaria berberidis CBS 394.84]|uniref:RING-type domain-containing protein n=1 Tax=Cucurbitaria berberidis CBS 394.84 TaxID=1168544 RepID=A0A9P4GQ87_9PLEO|nr:uncharacterized protein K460DRAFT_415722 [Cucurbitaria berberidis CBS 394.84]KAF1849339.1 hypothetical protein K460DRAFT_415722 [Cucurbitaria berberidis CBS 394.84]